MFNVILNCIIISKLRYTVLFIYIYIIYIYIYIYTDLIVTCDESIFPSGFRNADITLTPIFC